MHEERITLETGDGASGPAVAEVIRYGSGARVGKAVLFAVAGFAGGAACIIIPVLHLITTWALPLAGILLCVRTLKTHERLDRISGPCPACSEPLDLVGGTADQPRSCPKCGTALTVVLTKVEGSVSS